MISTDMGYALPQPGRPSGDTVVRTPACRSWRVSIAGPDDYPALAQLVIRTDPRQSGSADCEFLLRAVFPVCHTMLIRDGAEPVGLLARRRNWIEMLYVTHRLQGCGIGSALLAAARRNVGHYLRLECAADNVAALAFYAKHGFTLEESGGNGVLRLTTRRSIDLTRGRPHGLPGPPASATQFSAPDLQARAKPGSSPS